MKSKKYNLQKSKWIKRVFIFSVGLMLVPLGVVLCVECGLGISPVSILPYVMAEIFPLSFGEFTMLFHAINITLQYVLEKKLFNPKVLLQIPLSIVFGSIIDMYRSIIKIDDTIWGIQWLVLLGSILFTAFGMFCMIRAHLIQNPPDGTVRMISKITQLEIGKVKIIYDVIILICACVMGLLFQHKIVGVGIATIFSAFFVGKMLSWMKAVMCKLEEKNKCY